MVASARRILNALDLGGLRQCEHGGGATCPPPPPPVYPFVHMTTPLCCDTFTAGPPKPGPSPPGPRPGPSPPPPSPSPLPPRPPPPPLPPLPPRRGAPRPHVIVYLIDDMGWASVGWHNPNNTHTPNLNAAAAEGIILDRHCKRDVGGSCMCVFRGGGGRSLLRSAYRATVGARCPPPECPPRICAMTGPFNRQTSVPIHGFHLPSCVLFFEYL